MAAITGERAPETDDDPCDALSERLTALLNKNSAFRWRRCNPLHNTEPEITDLQWTTPLISRVNWTILKVKCNALTQNDRKALLVWKGGQPWRSSLQFFATILLFSIVVGVFLMSQLLLAAFSSLMWVVWKSMSLLVDWEEIYVTWCPLWFQNHVPRALKRSFDWIDAFLFAGRRFVGREWTDEDILWQQPIISLFSLAEQSPPKESWEKSILEAPPPALKHLGRRHSLEPRFVWTWMNRSRNDHDQENAKCFYGTSWSTAEHAVALHFCYLMLSDEQLDNDVSKTATCIEKGKQEQPTLQIFHEVQTRSSEVNTDSNEPQGNSEERTSFGRSQKDDLSKLVISQHQSDSTFVKFIDSPCQAEAFEVKVASPESGAGQQENQRSVPLAMMQLDELSQASKGSVRSEMSDVEADLPWIDVGAKIGMRFLNSAQAQRTAIPQENAELYNVGTTKRVGDEEGSTPGRKQLHKPIHSMWTSTMSVPLGSPLNEEKSDLPLDSSNLMLRSPHRTKHDNTAPFPQSAISSVEDPEEDRDAIEPTFTETIIMRDSSESKSAFSVDYVIQEDDTGVALLASENGDVEASQVKERSYPHVRRQPLSVGVKVAIPITPCQPGMKNRISSSKCQMGTVVHSQRIFVSNKISPCNISGTNAISVTCKLDRCFLRNGDFSELTFRVKDEWKDRYMPRHSKVPIGSCVSTSFGVGVLVGWRFEDDCHVVRCLWQRRGDGTAHAYMNRNAIHGMIEAAVGFEIGTNSGEGVVLACVQGGKTFESPRFLVALTDEGKRNGKVIDVSREDIMHCHGAQFIPVIEHIREAAIFQLQVDTYRAALREQRLEGNVADDDDDDDDDFEDEFVWDSWYKCVEIIWQSFLRAVDENKEFDEGLNEFVADIIDFLENLEGKEGGHIGDDAKDENIDDSDEVDTKAHLNPPDSRFWLVSEVFGDLFENDGGQEVELVDLDCQPCRQLQNEATNGRKKRYFERAFVVIKVLMRTVSIARAESVDFPVSYPRSECLYPTRLTGLNNPKRFRLSLSITYEFLIFCRTVLKVQQKNSVQSLEVRISH
jgi:hypothetical protein